MCCQLQHSLLIIDLFHYRFFAGGSERSGQQIVGPPKKKSTNEVVEDLFKGAKEHGAVPVDKAGKGLGESSRAKVYIYSNILDVRNTDWLYYLTL